MNLNESKKNEFFTQETLNYLENSFRKANLNKDDVRKILKWLSNPPRWTTIRVNRNSNTSLEESVQEVQSFINFSFQNLNEILSNEEKIESIPTCQVLNEINECIVFNSYFDTKYSENHLKKLNKNVIIDLKCAQAVLRGADIFNPGIIALSLNAKSKDEVSIYADLDAKCLKGSDSSLYVSNNPNSVHYIGNGLLMFDRDEIFKNQDTPKSGIGIKIKKLFNNIYMPSFEKLDVMKYYPQNLPSIICAKVLDPQENELILDMCAAPGGKTTHLAELVKNKSRIIAFDKISSKITKMKELCRNLNASCIECFCQDATKIDFNIYNPGSFDKILVDAPCSALGQRPLIFNNVTVNQLKSYISYQRMILDNAIKLLKPGGYLVYSTCTITLEENEEQVSWLMNKYKNMKIVSQEPYNLSSNHGLPCDGLSSSQLELLQRFLINLSPGQENVDESQSVYNDTNGFFISKFLKEY